MSVIYELLTSVLHINTMSRIHFSMFSENNLSDNVIAESSKMYKALSI